MNLKGLRELIGKEVRLRPRPKTAKGDLRESENRWIIIDETAEGVFWLKHYCSNHEVTLAKDHIRDFLTPNFLHLKSYVTLMDGGKVDVEPMGGPGLSDPDSIEELTDAASRQRENSVYEVLKSYVGKEVTIRFPDKDGRSSGPFDAVLDKCTPNFITVTRPEIHIIFPEWATSPQKTALPELPEQAVPARRIPSQTASVPLPVVVIAEDVEHDRPMIVFDHSYWKRDAF